MAERFNAAVLKTAEPLRAPRVRIPLSPKCAGPTNVYLWDLLSYRDRFVRPVLPTLIETDDTDFEWMTGDVSASKRGLTLPPGGVDSNEVLVHVRAIARSLQGQQGHTNNWMIVAENEVVGLCGYKHWPSVDGRVDIGYSISVSRRRRGHATSAVAAIIAKAEADPRIFHIIAETAIDNHASQRVLIKNGFQHIGTGIDPGNGERLLRWRVNVDGSRA